METNIYKKLFEVKKAGIKLQRDTEGYGYKYATLSQIQEKLNEEFVKQGLLITHGVIDNKVTTAIIDIEWDGKGDEGMHTIRSEIMMTEGIKAQDKGSEISYYRRYNLLSLLDLEVEDDDGKKAQNSTGQKVESKTNYPDNSMLPWIADTNIDKLTDLIAEGKHYTMQDIRDKYKISKVNAEKLKGLGIV